MTDDNLERAIFENTRFVERGLIGSVLQMSSLSGCENLKPEQFSNLILRVIWETIQELDHIEPNSLINALIEKGKKPPEDGWIAYVSGLILEGDMMQLPKFAENFQKLYMSRSLLNYASGVAKLTMNGRGPDAMIAETERMLDDLKSGHTPRERLQYRLDELMDMDFLEDAWMVAGLIPVAGITLLAGDIGSLKTNSSLDLSLCVSSKAEFIWGKKVEIGDPINVVYFGIDNRIVDLKKNTAKLAKGRGIDPHYDRILFDVDPLKLSVPEDVMIIERTIKSEKAELFVMDSMIRYLGSFNENESSDVGQIMANFRTISNETGCTFLLNHHLSKLPNQFTTRTLRDRIRGSGDWLGAVDSGIIITYKGEGADKRWTLTQVKIRQGVEIEPIGLGLEGDDFQSVITSSAGDPQEAAETKDDLAVQIMLDAMESKPGVIFSRKDLIEIVNSSGLHISGGTERRAFKCINKIPQINISKSGTKNLYQWSFEMDQNSVQGGFKNENESML